MTSKRRTKTWCVRSKRLLPGKGLWELEHRQSVFISLPPRHSELWNVFYSVLLNNFLLWQVVFKILLLKLKWSKTNKYVQKAFQDVSLLIKLVFIWVKMILFYVLTHFSWFQCLVCSRAQTWSSNNICLHCLIFNF